MDNVELLKLGFEGEVLELLKPDIIENKKKLNRLLSKARKDAKFNKCFYCNKEVTSFCNSHSVPAFCLKNIAEKGEVYHSNALVNIPLLDFKKGISNAGTFQIICKDCDSRIFQKYEEPNNYNNEPTPQMIAQIAMKNYLKAISKRINENCIYNILKEDEFNPDEILEHIQYINELDLNEFIKGFEKAKRLSKKNWDREYNVFYYEKLNYVVPIAFQSTIALVVDLDGQIINDIYCKNPKYKIQDFHVCVFPFKDSNIVMMFVDSKYKRYRNFYKKFRRLSHEEKLSIVNYIIFLYSEDIFLSKEIPYEVLQNKNLISVSKQSSIAVIINSNINPIEKAKGIYDLRKHNNIPNLLCEKYKLK